VRKQAPLLAATLQDVEDGVQDLTETVDPRSSVSLGGGQVRFDVNPFGIAKIGWVRFSHTCWSSELLPENHFSYCLGW
jgi:hypothetical protein